MFKKKSLSLDLNVANIYIFFILSVSEFLKTGAINETALCPYVLRLHLGGINRDLLEERNDQAGTHDCIIVHSNKKGQNHSE